MQLLCAGSANNRKDISRCQVFRYMLSDLFGFSCRSAVTISHCWDIHLAPIVQKVNNAIHWVNLHPVHSVISFPSTHPPDSHLSSGKRYPAYEQLPGARSSESEADWLLAQDKTCLVPVRNRMTVRFLKNAKTYFRTCFFFHNLTRDAPIWLLKTRECNLSIDHIYYVSWQTITTPQFTITIVQSQYSCDFVLTAVIMLLLIAKMTLIPTPV